MDAFRAAIFEEQEEHDVGGSDDDSASDENVAISEHDSDSEQEADDRAEEFTDNENDEINTVEAVVREPCYVGKDKQTIWRKHPIRSKFAKHAQKNLIKIFPRPILNHQGEVRPDTVFPQFITVEIVDEIVNCTNICIRQKQDAFSRIRDAKETTREEILALLGLLYFIGAKKQSHTDFHEIWDPDEGNIVCRACLSSKRFLFLLRVIRFDDINTRQERRLTDKLAPVRTILDKFVSNCKNGYVVGEFMTIDEMLVPYRGRCSFIQYLPKKPAKYGLKLFALCDSKTFYVSNLELYCGTQPNGPYVQSNTPSEIISRLVDPYKGKNRNLTCDNWYSSYPLAKDLLKKKITFVGTLKKNKREIPVELLPCKDRPVPSTIFAFQEDITLVSFCPKKSKAVLLLSTMHNDDAVHQDSHKPDIILFYNSTKGGIDTVDQKTGNFTVQRRTRRWPLVVFFQIMNIAALNSYIVYKFFPDNEVDRRLFLKNLAFSLMKPHLQTRANIINLPCDVKLYLTKYRTTNEAGEQQAARPRGKCSLCEWKKNRVTTIQCSTCQRLACKEHVITTHICLTCKDNQNLEEAEN